MISIGLLQSANAGANWDAIRQGRLLLSLYINSSYTYIDSATRIGICAVVEDFEGTLELQKHLDEMIARGHNNDPRVRATPATFGHRSAVPAPERYCRNFKSIPKQATA